MENSQISKLCKYVITKIKKVRIKIKRIIREIDIIKKYYPKAFFLITVLTSITLTTAVVTQITEVVSRSAVVLTEVKNSVTADSVCDIALEVVKKILQDDLGRSGYDYYSENFSDIDELWSKAYIFPLDVVYGTIRAIITDETGKLNVNALVDSRGKTEGMVKPNYLRVLEHFFKIIKLPEQLAGYIIDYIDSDSEGLYELPDLQWNWFIPYPEILLKIAEISKADISKLFIEYFEGRPDAIRSPYLTFWPYAGSLKINVNTAPKEVIASFIDLPDALDIAQKIYDERKERPFKSFSEFVSFLGKMIPVAPQTFFGLAPEMIFDVRSDVFSVKILCKVSNTESELQAVLLRGQGTTHTLFFRRL